MSRPAQAYLTDENVPVEERGRYSAVLLGHAVVAMLLGTAEVGWVVTAAVRVWRRRHRGLAPAMRNGVHRPTLAVLLGAHLAYTVFRRAIRTSLDDRAREHQAGTRR
jgi:ABC-type uncharacterized transport system YnjBCD permease subunit